MQALLGFALALAMASPALAPDEARLDASPRHHEWVDVTRKTADGSVRTIRSFVAYPETKDKALAIVVIHENKGLTDWVRSVADRLAEAGYIAIAPDLLSAVGPGGGNTDAFESTDAATQAIYALAPDAVTADLDAVADHAKKIPAASGKLAVAGFCWGGAQSFRFATTRDDLAAAFVFYGSAPEDRHALAEIDSPVYGFYGGNDARINATIPETERVMKELGKRYEPVIYPDAGHGFLRAGEGAEASEANRKAREEAWKRWTALLGALSK